MTGAGAADDDFNQGLTMELITLLQNVKGLQVLGPMASLRIKSSTDPKQVGEQFKVDHLLQGKVSRSGQDSSTTSCPRCKCGAMASPVLMI